MSDSSHLIRIGVGSLQDQPSAAAPSGAPLLTPPIDIYDSPEGLILEADLPGAAEDSLLVQLHDNVLSIQASTRPIAGADASVLHREFVDGVYARSFILSDEVDRERIVAVYRHGVLKLTLPRSERSRLRRIDVKSS